MTLNRLLGLLVLGLLGTAFYLSPDSRAEILLISATLGSIAIALES